jgi:PAS domain S-box-containing protein
MALIKSISKDDFFIDQLSNVVKAEAIVSVTDLSGVIVYVNENFCRISGYDEDELIGTHHRIINSNFHPREFFEKMWIDITSGKTWKGEVKNKKKDGTFYWVLSTIVPIRNQQGHINYFISVRQDVTEQKEIQASFIQASKISALGEVTAKIAHELNNPLAVIMGMSQMLINRHEADENAIGKMKKILKASERMDRLIQQMKKHSRNTKDDPKKPISLDLIVNNSLILLEASLASNQIKIDLNLPLNSPLVLGDMVHLESVIMNFLSNSVDAFIKPHSPNKIENRCIEISIHCDSEFVNLIYKDNAGGIPEHVQKHMFDTFFTTKEAGKGTGLGLSMIKNVIEDHKAKLSFQSILGQGTEFRIQFPVFQGLEGT